jgi:hypothetical protein
MRSQANVPCLCVKETSALDRWATSTISTLFPQCKCFGARGFRRAMDYYLFNGRAIFQQKRVTFGLQEKRGPSSRDAIDFGITLLWSGSRTRPSKNRGGAVSRERNRPFVLPGNRLLDNEPLWGQRLGFYHCARAPVLRRTG